MDFICRERNKVYTLLLYKTVMSFMIEADATLKGNKNNLQELLYFK